MQFQGAKFRKYTIRTVLQITTLIFRNFYMEIPDEMLEAAAIDGAGFSTSIGKLSFHCRYLVSLW